jgi:hypothetical protein
MLAEIEKRNLPAARRTQRIMERIEVIVSGKLSDRTNFEEESCTSALSADGAVLPMRAPVHKGQVLRVVQKHTGEQALCVVAHVGPAVSGRLAVRLQLLETDSRFWNIACPPDNWTRSLGDEEQELAASSRH